VKKDKGQVQKKGIDDRFQKCTQVALKSGRAQAFRAMALLNEFLEWKTLAEVIDGEQYLDIPGIDTIDQYFEYIGLGRRTGFNQLKVARTLTPDEVQLFTRIGLTKRDLIGYANLSEEDRLQIREGKLKNLDKADKEDVSQLIEDLLDEKKKIKDVAVKLQKDNDTIGQELKALRAAMPNQHNMDWAWLSIESISKHISGIQSDMNFLLDSMDHRLIDNSEFNARVNGLYDTAQRMLIEVFDKIDKLTGHHPGREKAGE
jgi:hypothetical protein